MRPLSFHIHHHQGGIHDIAHGHRRESLAFRSSCKRSQTQPFTERTEGSGT